MRLGMGIRCWTRLLVRDAVSGVLSWRIRGAGIKGTAVVVLCCVGKVLMGDEHRHRI